MLNNESNSQEPKAAKIYALDISLELGVSASLKPVYGVDGVFCAFEAPDGTKYRPILTWERQGTENEGDDYSDLTVAEALEVGITVHDQQNLRMEEQD